MTPKASLARIGGSLGAALLTIGLAPIAGPASPAAADPALDWSACALDSLAADDIECATMTVPMDRNDATGPTFALAVLRHRSSGTPEQRIGSLFVNPGGPGGAGSDVIAPIWSILPEAVRKRFDLVTWDPRGTGLTRPVLTRCASPWPDRPDTGPVGWRRVIADFRTALRPINAACQERNAAFIEHIGTNEAVADLDRLRAAVGDEKLTYWGISYGTRIGYVYALAHPDRIRAVILDGSIDPAGTLASLTDGGAAPDQAFGSFADAFPQAAQQLTEVLAVLDTRTQPLPGGRQLTRWDVLDTVYGPIAAQGAYVTISEQIATMHTAVLGSGEEQQQAAKELAKAVRDTRRQPSGAAGGMFAVVNCLDYPQRPGLDQITRRVVQQVRYAPRYGGSLATMFGTNCAGFTFAPDPVPVITGQGPAVPLMIAGSTRDGSTIVQWTARMSRAFPASRTVTYAGGQHAVWNIAGSACVDRVLDTYILTLRRPAADRACPNAYRPPEAE